MIDTLDGASVAAWAQAAADSLERRRAEIDALNVFPVADTDTGSNLAATMRAGADAVLDAVGVPSVVSSAAATALTLAQGAARSARGNSGVILAELLRGLAEAIAAGDRGGPTCDAALLRRALDQATGFAYAAVGQPVEGTMLSVVRGAERASRALAPDAGLAAVVCAARDGAVAALANTPAQLAVLAEAGVVDAGGLGLVVIFDALCTVVAGVTGTEGSTGSGSAIGAPARHRNPDPAANPAAAPGYEVQYLLEAPDGVVGPLRASLAALGDSLTVARVDANLWNVHIHVDDVGAAIEAGMRGGRPRDISVTRLVAAGPRDDQPPRQRSAVLVVLDGPQLSELFEGVGAGVVVIESAIGVAEGDGAASLQSAGLAALSPPTGPSRCLVLPCDERLAELAGRVAARLREQGIDVAVVPCRSPLQAIAAIAVHDDTRRDEDDLIAMAEAAAGTRFARIEIATGAALTTIGACQAGDVLGLIDGDVVEIGSSATDVTLSVVTRLLGIGGELMTVIVDGAATPDLGGLIRRYVSERAPLVDLTVHPVAALAGVALLGME